MATWPPELPQSFDAEGFRETPPSLAVRSPMDIGPAKVRRRQTVGPTTFDGQLPPLSYDQANILVWFWQAVCEGGVLSFTWKHPRTQATAKCRFVEPPAMTHFAGAALWRASLKVEVLP